MPQTTWDIFHLLLNSSAFTPSDASIITKFEIFHDFWMNEVNWLRGQYDERGVATDGTDNRGFGFLVEEFARRSKKLPPALVNTERGQRMAGAILNALHAGNSDVVQLGRSRSQGDLLGVRQKGRLTTIVGVGEVKSSFEAFKKKFGQLGRQERSLTFFTERISGSTHSLFRKKKVEVADDLKKYLIIPFGQRERFVGCYLSGDIEIVEIEFSYHELAFVAKLVWPYVLPGLVFERNEIQVLWAFIAGELNDFIRPRTNEVLAVEQFSCWELGLFAWATSRLPVLDEDRQLAVELVRRLYWEALENVLRSPIDLSDLNGREKEFYRLFAKGNSGDRCILLYLSLARYLGEKVTEEFRKIHKVRTLKNRMLDVNLLDL